MKRLAEMNLTEEPKPNNELKDKKLVFGITYNEDSDLRIIALEDGLPAQTAGLKVGDIVQAIDGYPVNSAGVVRHYTNGRGERAPFRLTVLRGAQTIDFSITPSLRKQLAK